MLFSGTIGNLDTRTINGKFSDYNFIYIYASTNNGQGWGHMFIPRIKFQQKIEEWLYIGSIASSSDYYYCSVKYVSDTQFQGKQVSATNPWNVEVYGISLSK